MTRERPSQEKKQTFIHHMLSCLSFSSIIFKDRYRQSRNPFPRILRQCFHGGPRPRSISRSPIVDRERRLDASNLLRGSQRTLRQKQGKRLASLAYRVWIFPLPFLLLFLSFFLFSCSFLSYVGTSSFLRDSRHFDNFYGFAAIIFSPLPSWRVRRIS